jgi:hypothetical protein
MVPWRLMENHGAGLPTSLQNAARKDMDQQQASVLPGLIHLVGEVLVGIWERVHSC